MAVFVLTPMELGIISLNGHPALRPFNWIQKSGSELVNCNKGNYPCLWDLFWHQARRLINGQPVIGGKKMCGGINGK